MSNGTIIIIITTENWGSQVQTLARRRFNAALIVLTWSSSSSSSALLPSLPESATTETTILTMACVWGKPALQTSKKWLGGRVPDLQSGGCRFESRPGLLHTKVYSAFHPSMVGKWVPAVAGKAKAGIAHSTCGLKARCAGKTVIPWQCMLYLSA